MKKNLDICLREFFENDIVPVKRLIDHTIDSSYTGVYPPNAVRFFKQFHSTDRILEEAKDGNMVVLEREGNIVGTGAIIGNRVFRVFVAPRFHRKGYGKIIMNSLEAKARSNGLSEIILDVSLPSIGFYKSLGYDLFEEASIDVGDGESLDYFRARKALKKKRFLTTKSLKDGSRIFYLDK